MSKRTVALLAIAFVVLLVLVFVGQREDGGPAGAGTALVPDLEAALANVERVTIERAGGETVATLEKRPESWVVAEKDNYPADATKLRQALTALAEARVLEQKTSNAELYGRIGVEDTSAATATGITVALTVPGRELPAIVLGNAEGSRYRYVRRAGEAQSYLVDRNPDVPRSAAQWLESVIVDIRPDRVREVTITHADGEVVRISKDSPELANFDVADVPEGRELSYPGVANVIGGALRELRLEDVEPAAEDAGEPAAVVEYRTFDGLLVRVTGTERDEQSFIALEASADAAAAPAEGAAPAESPAAEAERINAKVGGWRYKIASFQYDQITRRMADLLRPPPAE